MRRLKPAKLLMEFEDNFYEVLERVQGDTADLISKELCVRDVLGISRSLRGGVTMHSKNAQIDKQVRDTIN